MMMLCAPSFSLHMTGHPDSRQSSGKSAHCVQDRKFVEWTIWQLAFFVVLITRAQMLNVSLSFQTLAC